MKKDRPRIIAFYLPQYHPTPDNDRWWGKGFTEWTNVGRAKALFRGHYQPKVPADLGYYDLRLPEIRKAQAELAKEAGVEGFCYYHYWFGNGRKELELPFNEVLRLGEPDFPFCLCWANESWHSKFWDSNGHFFSKKTLIEQEYLGHNDNVAHFMSLLPAFKDKRYMTIDGRIIFMIYRPLHFEGIKEFIEDWRELAVRHGLKGFYFVGQLGQLGKDPSRKDIDFAISLGLDAVNIVRLWSALSERSILRKVFDKLYSMLTGMPRIANYKNVYLHFIGKEECESKIYPTIIPNWDHSPRSGYNGYVLRGATPELFKLHVHRVLNIVMCKKQEEQIVFLKSWNEWGEGNYMEPDLKYGRQYIDVLRSEVEHFGKNME